MGAEDRQFGATTSRYHRSIVVVNKCLLSIRDKDNLKAISVGAIIFASEWEIRGDTVCGLYMHYCQRCLQP